MNGCLPRRSDCSETRKKPLFWPFLIVCEFTYFRRFCKPAAYKDATNSNARVQRPGPS